MGLEEVGLVVNPEKALFGGGHAGKKYNSAVLGPSPYAVAAPAFRFRALASLAGRAALGGPREAALATLVAARLCDPEASVTPEVRAARADGARAWIGTVAAPAVAKAAIGRLIETSARGDAAAMAVALAKVTDVTAPYLDKAARSELEQLVLSLRGTSGPQSL